ncbi:acyl-CoA dehydrogenase [Mycobacterium sp.]|uniref:acyl-CoA dehydrogenase n=1 Tax=Mycobacterium sp. TaxID=1785 RepID=UPI003BB109D2
MKRIYADSHPPLLNPRDIDFLLYEWLDVGALCDRPRYREHSIESFDSVLDLAADIAIKRFAPHFKTADTEEPFVNCDGTVTTLPEVKEALSAAGAAGLLAGDFDHDVDGYQLPYVVSRAAFAWLQAANVSTAAYLGLTVANAHLLAAYGNKEQIDTWVRPMLDGRYQGTMCLSEPHAGSSLANITTRAVRQEDGTYRITGTKMWISGGDHEMSDNIVHLVLAKTPGGPAGVKGISLFIVPKHLVDDGGRPESRNSVVLVGLNHKMGNHGTTNALLNFGDESITPDGRSGAIGYLVGNEFDGLRQMFHMMNEARVSVGLSATAQGYTGYLQALAYARTRLQGRPLSRGKSVDEIPIISHPDVRRMLLAQKSYVEGALGLGLYCGRLIDETLSAPTDIGRDDARLLLEVLTPIAKSWPSQWAVEANSLAIQVHGGYGYTRDYNVEQLYRDNRLNSIHEGTHGIHALDLLGRKVLIDGGRGLRLLLDKIRDTADQASAVGDPLAGWATTLTSAALRVEHTSGVLWKDADPASALANATIYLEAVGHVVLAWIWLQQALAAHRKAGDFFDGKRLAARYFFRYELPKTTAQFDLLDSGDRTTTDLDDNWF